MSDEVTEGDCPASKLGEVGCLARLGEAGLGLESGWARGGSSAAEVNRLQRISIRPAEVAGAGRGHRDSMN